MDFAVPPELTAYLAELDAFIAAEIAPLQAADDNERFFDHRREHARTDWDNDGLPRPEWEALLGQASLSHFDLRSTRTQGVEFLTMTPRNGV